MGTRIFSGPTGAFNRNLTYLNMLYKGKIGTKGTVIAVDDFGVTGGVPSPPVTFGTRKVTLDITSVGDVPICFTTLPFPFAAVAPQYFVRRMIRMTATTDFVTTGK